jgi:hypothetical protein
MPLLQLVIILIVIGVLLWLMNTYIPMDAKIKTIINILVVIVVILWLCSLFGLFNALHDGPTVRPIR